jgi:hypothetical protein
MGRKKKPQGCVLLGPHGRPIRFNARIDKGPYPSFLHQKQPRGRTVKTWLFTNLLKERAPLVYVFVVNEVNRGWDRIDPKLQRIMDEGFEKQDLPRKPSARELTAYLIERAFQGAWAAWNIEPPYRQGLDKARSFIRRYVHGHPEAIRDFRLALSLPKPWDRFHVGHDLKYFLGQPGAAAKYYNMLEPRQLNCFVKEIQDT